MKYVVAIQFLFFSLSSVAQDSKLEQVTTKYNETSCEEIARLLRVGGRKLELDSFTRGDDRSELMFHSIKQLIRRGGECLTDIQDELKAREMFDK